MTRPCPGGTRGGALTAGVEVCLNSLGYPHTVQGEGPFDIRFVARTARGCEWPAQAVVYEDTATLLVSVALSPNGYPAHKKGWIREVVARLNETTAILGFFVVRWDDGSVYYSCGLDLQDTRPDPFLAVERIQRLLSTIAFPVSVWERSFRHINSEKVDPLSALGASLVENECFDDTTFSAGARRVLLELEDGGLPAVAASPISDLETGRPSLRLL